MFKRVISSALALIFALTFSLPAAAEEQPPYSYVLMEGGTSALLYSENGNAQIQAHHAAKLMTLLLTAEAVERGELDLNSVLKTSKYANSMQGAQIWLMPGEEITLDELIKAITVGNANDACVVLAEALGGSEEKFAELMNLRAEQLGMTGTHYNDSTGISVETVTTACDTAILASALSRFDFLKEYFTTWICSVRGGRTELASTNRLILNYSGITGMKAYYGKSCGNCVVASAERDGLTLICVIFGESDEYRRFATAKEKLNAGFSAYTLYRPKRSDVFTEPVRVSGGETTEVKTELGPLSPFVIRKSAADSVEISLEYQSGVAAPLKKGDPVGRAVYSVAGEEVYSCPIVSGEEVRKMNIFIGMKRTLFSLLKM